MRHWTGLVLISSDHRCPRTDPHSDRQSIRVSRQDASAETMFVFVSNVQKGPKVISDAAIEVFRSASIQPRFLTLTLDDVKSLEFLAQQVKEILDREETWGNMGTDGTFSSFESG